MEKKLNKCKIKIKNIEIQKFEEIIEVKEFY